MKASLELGGSHAGADFLAHPADGSLLHLFSLGDSRDSAAGRKGGGTKRRRCPRNLVAAWGADEEAEIVVKLHLDQKIDAAFNRLAGGDEWSRKEVDYVVKHGRVRSSVFLQLRVEIFCDTSRNFPGCFSDPPS